MNQATSRLPHGAGSPIFLRVFGLLAGLGTAPETSAPRCSGNSLQPYRGLAYPSRAVGVDLGSKPRQMHIRLTGMFVPVEPDLEG